MRVRVLIYPFNFSLITFTPPWLLDIGYWVLDIGFAPFTFYMLHLAFYIPSPFPLDIKKEHPTV